MTSLPVPDLLHHMATSQFLHQQVQNDIVNLVMGMCAKEDDLGPFIAQSVEQLLLARGLIRARANLADVAQTLLVKNMIWGFPELKLNLEVLGVHPNVHYDCLCIPRQQQVAIINSPTPAACRHIASCLHGVALDSMGHLLVPPLEAVPVASSYVQNVLRDEPENCFLFLPTGECKWGSEIFQAPLSADDAEDEVVDRSLVDALWRGYLHGNDEAIVAENFGTFESTVVNDIEVADTSTLRVSALDDTPPNEKAILCRLTQEGEEEEKENTKKDEPPFEDNITSPEEKKMELLLKLLTE